MPYEESIALILVKDDRVFTLLSEGENAAPGEVLRFVSDTNFGDKLSDAMKDQVLLLLQLRDFHLQDSRARSRLFPAFAEDSTSCTCANALWRFLESSARSAFLPRTQGFRAFPHHTRRPQISTVS